jgi:large exoprotein involved in heme utilization and adhesion
MRVLICLFASILALSPAFADIATDGTLGPQLELPGPDFQIGAQLGQQHGGNLFHSFQTFDVHTGESATSPPINFLVKLCGSWIRG